MVAFEIVTSRGELLRVTKDSDPELFACLPWSHGAAALVVGWWGCVGVVCTDHNYTQERTLTQPPTYTYIHIIQNKTTGTLGFLVSVELRIIPIKK